jgi:hypothetical protein
MATILMNHSLHPMCSLPHQVRNLVYKEREDEIKGTEEYGGGRGRKEWRGGRGRKEWRGGDMYLCELVVGQSI